ncbi:MAG: threonylcarbamoyl-AMP synthase [Bacteroidales bacterium]|nr:threonylcarbamoyl-AMP synthase [Bacteroidales bacterium]
MPEINLEDIQKAANLIRAGKLVAFPTETVYGLGANALDPKAVAEIFKTKERPSFDPLIVHIHSLAQLDLLTKNTDSRVYRLAEKFWPGPLTIVLSKSKVVPDIVTSGLPTVGIRMPRNEIALELIRQSGCPIAAPSANKFGRISPTKAQHVEKQLKNVDYILDGGQTTVGIESTVITLHVDGFVILRQGIITKEDLESVLPQSLQSIENDEQISSPGHIKSHYSPTKPIYILNEDSKRMNTKNAAFLSFGSSAEFDVKTTEFLSSSGNLTEAAVNLFEKLHSLEESDCDFIIAEPVPEEGIGIAIMDRLRKAAHKYLKS